MNIIKNDKINETLYYEILDNGLTVYLYPKKDFVGSRVALGTRYGSIDNNFVDIYTNEEVKVPDGIAHFLEHKLFEKEDESTLDMFAKLGMRSNAYTTFDHTVYFVDCSCDLTLAIKELINMVYTPIFTDQNVEKEKGIIGQEIEMYNDDPYASVYYNALRGIYSKHPINIDIAGTIESISKITKEQLYTCYNNFYNPKNMFIVVCGDFNEKEILKLIKNEFENVNKLFKDTDNNEIKRIFDNEPKTISKNSIEKKLDVYNNQFILSFKLDSDKEKNNIKKEIIYRLINQIYFSETTDFYDELYRLNLITRPIDLEYSFGNGYAHCMFVGETTSLDIVIEKLKEYIKSLKDKKIDNESIERAKNKTYGDFIMSYEDIDSIVHGITDNFMHNTRIFEDIEILSETTKEEIEDLIKIDFDFDKMSVSKICPKA